MRSLAQSQVGRLIDGSMIRFGGLSSMLRSALPYTGSALQLGRPAVSAVYAAAAQQLKGFFRRATSLIEPIADRIDSAIVDLSPADPAIALDIYAGVFRLASKTVAAHGRLIFIKPVPSLAWARELHGFTWLRHLVSADTPLAKLNARTLIEDWIDLDDDKRIPALTLEPGVVAARLQSWLTHAAWLSDGATPIFRQRLLAQVTRQFRLLRQSRGRTGLDQVRVAVALLAASTAVPAFRRFHAAASRQLDAELKVQILADGGHISRNPSTIINVLAEILPLRAAMAHAGIPASGIMMNSIDRMLPMVRFFSDASGSIANFNGAAPLSAGLIDAVLSYDDAGGRAHGNASHSGYQRLDAEGTAVLMDCGAPPPTAYAERAHAGTLSFEFASGTNRFVINCGSSAAAHPDWRSVARETAAHSTVVLDGKSSARPIETGFIAHMVGPTLIGGPSHLTADRREHGGAIAVVASHDGYAARHNLIHERTLRLSATGDRIDGRDLLMPSLDAPTSPADYVVRFHLDRAIQPVLLANGVVMLIAPDGEAWEFHTDAALPTLEDSVYLAGPDGPVPTRQIVLAASLPDVVEQRWTFVRTRGSTHVCAASPN